MEVVGVRDREAGFRTTLSHDKVVSRYLPLVTPVTLNATRMALKLPILTGPQPIYSIAKPAIAGTKKSRMGNRRHLYFIGVSGGRYATHYPPDMDMEQTV